MAPAPDSAKFTTADDDPSGEIELDPTVFAADDSVTSGETSFHMALVEGAPPTISGESETLLRSRLLASATFLALAYGTLFLFGLLAPSTGVGIVIATGGLRMAFAALAAIVLASPLSLRLGTLRLVEYAFFGTLVVISMGTQYYAGTRLIENNDLPHLIALEKNGVINIIVLMFIYGVLIPNNPKDTARTVLTMALGPLAVLALLVHTEEELSATLSTGTLEISNTLFILLGAALSIYTAHTLNKLRKDLRKAKQLGQYQLGEKLGEGGMGEVYMAEHQLLKRPCALKLIKPDVERNPIALARFEREVRSAAMLSHPNTIEIFDYGHSDDGTFYYVMEYLPGLSVSELVKQSGPLPPGRAVYLMRQVCGSLAEAHRVGLVHRDLKPANILVSILGGKCDVAKVLDFGLVKLTADPETPQLTADFTVSGTPQYMSPEQATASKDVDGRADIYALGAILYYMLAGRPPFDGTNPTELMIAHARDPIVPPSQYRQDIPDDLEAVVVRCLAKKPTDRFPDAKAVSNALAACQCAADWDEARAEQWWLQRAEEEVLTEANVAAPA